MSSSGDHLDCFLAGDSQELNSAVLAGLLAGMTEEVVMSVRFDDDAALGKAESDRPNDCGEHGLCGDSLSSCLMSREISTVEG